MRHRPHAGPFGPADPRGHLGHVGRLHVHLERGGQRDGRAAQARAARSTARRAASAIIARATSGCWFTAPNLVKDSLTTTRSASARNGSASAAVCRSPVISPTGTAAGQRDQGVDAALADPDPVQRDVRDHRRVVGVRQHRALAGDRPVVAHHEHDVRAGLEALHHVQRLVPPGHVGRLAVQQLRVQVVHRPVRVVADDLGGAGRQRPVDRRVDLAEQQPPALLVGLAGRAALGPVDDPGHALHVEGDEDLHPERAGACPGARPRRPPGLDSRVPTPARRLAARSARPAGSPPTRPRPRAAAGTRPCSSRTRA